MLFPPFSFWTVSTVAVSALRVSDGLRRHGSHFARFGRFPPLRARPSRLGRHPMSRFPPATFGTAAAVTVFPFRLDASMLANSCARLRTSSIASNGVPSRRCEDVHENVRASSHKSKHQQLAALAAMLKFVINCEQRVCEQIVWIFARDVCEPTAT